MGFILEEAKYQDNLSLPQQSFRNKIKIYCLSKLTNSSPNCACAYYCLLHAKTIFHRMPKMTEN